MTDTNPTRRDAKIPTDAPAEDLSEASFWARYRHELTFVGVFMAILAIGFTVISLQPVNDNVIVPFTGGVAKASGWTLASLGQGTEMQGTVIRNDKFAVNIKNGCNGVETMIIFLAAVLAFPAPWKARLAGLALGIVAIQLVNLIRVVALFFTGAYFPEFFDSSHTVVWQTLVIGSGVLLFIFWANRFAAPPTGVAGEPATAD